MNSEVSVYFEQLKAWKEELSLAREYCLSTELVEELKWKQPCYTVDGKNILILSGFKQYCAVGFFKGALINDKHKMLVCPGGNSQSTMMIKFTDLKQVRKAKSTILDYIAQAIQIEHEGKSIAYKSVEEYHIPEELETIFKADNKFRQAFNRLTDGRKKGYLLHFTAAKQSQTKTNRINKFRTRIIDGKGMLDCVCGLSKSMPRCDGSHKQLKVVG